MEHTRSELINYLISYLEYELEKTEQGHSLIEFDDLKGEIEQILECWEILREIEST